MYLKKKNKCKGQDEVNPSSKGMLRKFCLLLRKYTKIQKKQMIYHKIKKI